MRILLVGDDAVAHAVAEQLAKNCELYALMQKPNPGITKATQQSYVCDFSNIEVIGSWALRQKIDLVFITAKEALYAGLTDALQDAGLKVASPSMAAASIGNNRAYARTMLRAFVRFPRYAICKDAKAVKNALKDFNRFLLKPTIRSEWQALRIAESKDEKVVLTQATKLIKRHGSVVIEEYADGEEFTIQAISDGKNVSIFPPIRVAKHALDGDVGDNTEGMASYSTGNLLSFLAEDDFRSAKVMVEKIIAVLRAKGTEYKGLLHARFIISAKGIKLVDLESSFGNPEGINCMAILKTQFSDVLQDIVNGRLQTISFSDKPTVVKYAVPKEYPAESKKKSKNYGELGLDEKKIWDNGCKYYFEGIEKKDEKLFLTNKRAVAMFASCETLEEAEQRVSTALATLIGSIRWRQDVATKQYVDKRMKRASALKGSFLYLKPVVRKS